MIYTIRIFLGALCAWINTNLDGMSFRNYHKR